MEEDYFKISRNELRRLLILEIYAKALMNLSLDGDFYGELYKIATEGNVIKDDVQQELRKSFANEAVQKKVENMMKEKYESLE